MLVLTYTYHLSTSPCLSHKFLLTHSDYKLIAYSVLLFLAYSLKLIDRIYKLFNNIFSVQQTSQHYFLSMT